MKKQNKKRISVLLAAALTTTALAGCGAAASGTAQASSATADTASSAVSETAGPVTLRFSWWGSDSRHQALLSVIKAYEAKYPNVTIEAEYQGYDGYYEKIMTTLSSNTAPDIIQLSKEWLPDIQGAKHYLADLTTLPVDLSTLKENLLEISGTYNNEAIMFPCTVGGSVVYVNTDFATAHGIDLTKAYTWDEIKAVGQAVHQQNPEDYLMTADADMLNRLFVQGYLTQKSGKPLIDEETYTMNFTEEDVAQAFQNIVDLYATNTLEPFGDAAAFAGQADQNTKWINGKIGMIVDYTGSAPKYEASVSSPLDVIATPVVENAKSSGVGYGGDRGYAINDNSANKEEAAKFLDYLMNDPESIRLCKTAVGYCPTKQADDILIAEGAVSELQKKSVEIAAVNAYTQNMVSANTELEALRKDLVQEVVYGDVTPENAAKELVEQYQEILDELKKGA